MTKRTLLLFFASSSLFGCRLTERRLEKDFEGLRVPSLHTHVLQEKKLQYLELPQDTVPLVMFIHGTPGSMRNFIGFFKDSLLSKDFHLISVDRPGFGGSGKGKFVPLAEQSKRLAMLLEPYATRTIILAGHSYGGPVALQMALDFPTLVDGVLLLAPAIDPDFEDPRWYNYMGRMGMINVLLPSLIRVTNDELLALKAELERLDAQHGRLKLPIYYIHGTKDMFVSFQNTYYARKKFSDITVEILEDVNHFIPWTNSEDIKKGLYTLKERLMP